MGIGGDVRVVELAVRVGVVELAFFGQTRGWDALWRTQFACGHPGGWYGRWGCYSLLITLAATVYLLIEFSTPTERESYKARSARATPAGGRAGSLWVSILGLSVSGFRNGRDIADFSDRPEDGRIEANAVRLRPSVGGRTQYEKLQRSVKTRSGFAGRWGFLFIARVLVAGGLYSW